MLRRTLLALLATGALLPSKALANHPGDLFDPPCHIAKGGKTAPRVALTLDACMGGFDHRIMDVLLANDIRTTFFVTARWIAANPAELVAMRERPDLFRIENHGDQHVPAVIGTEPVYGIAPAGTLDAIRREIKGGADAITANQISAPLWYRDATALYSPEAIELIGQMGYRVAGYSLNADFGASLAADKVAARIADAKDGDVIIAHINQPKRASGAGVAEGVLRLKAKGFAFDWLDA